ncbi:Cro/C1-type HTH DNA-binding domain-containing protein [Butyrivibrio sp. INlla18]|uniref:helix-turn-helix domain-containing protein n=1 Tax=Butyrivibrio sp. INlla18 TaxID=1520806 RepID=UPI0008898D6A|nr:helix-turn-helix transcriptional regulator [Butyrivibrio sp. INlla18]SDA63014.1 Cro/C1-type HTH DNA-binding domain-containing protein [Butyrivibrio sp. INlla18]
MYIKQYLEDNNISIYKVANSALVAYPTVFNIVNGKVDILNCALGVVKKIADALNLTIDELLTLCDKNYSFDLFRSEQCHLVNRMGEIEYVIELLEKKKIDYYWKLNMKVESFYLLAMLDYLSKRNEIPKCTEYEELRKYKLEKLVFPADTELSEKLLGKDAHKEALDHAIPEFLDYNIVECEIING